MNTFLTSQTPELQKMKKKMEDKKQLVLMCLVQELRI